MAEWQPTTYYLVDISKRRREVVEKSNLRLREREET
jgi:hypothetical protein